MTEQPRTNIRPAGAPMVPMSRPGSDDADGGSGSERVDQLAGQAREAGGELAGQAKQVGGEIAGQAKEVGAKLAGDARDAARVQVDDRSTKAGASVREAAHDVRDIAEELRRKGRDRPARLADQAAERMEAFGSYLQESDADRIMGDARRFARERPAVVVAGAAVVGIVAGRLLKASEPEREVAHR
ncbi:hypothetical protein [Miltoncostaea marina]|uniref:hypothetical protein n=1 Tax=Miltoncostaea marina TaxID=2843215 RepID=UPI001C3DEA85|nr:hypothetical protein [Miltoncostaea marina]